MPKTRSGKWVVGFGVAMVVLLAISLIFAMAIGGNSTIVASNSLLSILAATLSVMFTLAGPLSFFIGIYTIIRYKEWSIGRLFLAINLKNMKIIKNRQLLIVSLMLAIAFCSSAVLAKAQDSGKANGAEHRSAVATFVQNLSDVADNEKGGIGDQIKVVASEQNDSKDKVADAIDKIQNRNGIKTFLIGTDYKNVGQLRSEMVKTGNQIEQLTRLSSQTTNAESKTALSVQIQALEQEQQKINDFLKTNESKFSLFGWFVKLFNK